jgi:hypothetical protein
MLGNTYTNCRVSNIEVFEMEVCCRMCGVSSDQAIVTTRSDFGDVLCQTCYEKRLDEWAIWCLSEFEWWMLATSKETMLTYWHSEILTIREIWYVNWKPTRLLCIAELRLTVILSTYDFFLWGWCAAIQNTDFDGNWIQTLSWFIRSHLLIEICTKYRA